ncbi:unnamed protein product [Plutella xylostella]|uniref:(diamondback moth) hypothetical protein n=1 Tax=Plutella xylostella TaxID=51655 RepID=A0A8S4G094_PLUXY|nr:unnamed protein product [Plutella xylostella]
MGKSSISLSIVCAFFVLSVLWKPALSDDKCSIGCKGTPSGASFLAGHKYNYAVEGVVSIYLSGADKQETSVKLLGQVSVSALGNCAHVLKVNNLVISGPGGKKYSKPPGLDKPVRFTLQDGHVGADLCTEEGDTRRSLNIKRAVISLLQTGTKSGTEVDIFGACPTDASSSQEGGATLVHRVRDLGRCGHREHGRNDLITAVYNPQAEIKNTQVLQSTLNVESKVTNGVPEKVSATEDHLYKPFSVGENGVRSKVHTKLTLTGQAAGADAGKFTSPRSIIFENPHGVAADHSSLQSAVAAVKETAKAVAHEAGSHSAGDFAQLVRILRVTSKDDLTKAYQQVKGNKLEKRVFLDGLVRAGSGDSIEVSVGLLKGGELSDLESKVVFLSLGNARHVSNDAIKAATALLDDPKAPKEVYLGVGALASAYCRSHNCHDGKSEGIVALSQKLGSKLNCKAKGKVHEDYVVAALKGIRNIRHLEDSIIEKVVHCAADNAVKARVRVAALEAFRADPCSAKVKKAALDLLKNRQLDSEIRIKAYLAVIDCPCGKSANEIKTLLDSEPVHQVGRFITTSLRHIRASTSADRAPQRQHYGLIRTPSKFNVDDRKYSFYREASYNVDALGVGGSVEQTVIYSQDSFLPRSASLNLTAEVFGHNFNVLEVGGRQGNLDRVVEHFLGPKSFLRTEEPQELYNSLVKKFKEAEQKVEGKIRGRRSVKTDIDNFDKHIKAEAAPFDNELDMDIYVKLFGTDAIFLSLGDDKGFNYNDVLDAILKYVDTGINQAKHFQQEIRAHLLFLDAELAYATSTGLPLKLKLIGAATGRFEVATSVDIRQIIKDPKNAKFDVKLIPSTDIEVSGLFLVDADAVATGIKVVTNLHSSTGGHVIVKILENGQGFDLQIGLPIEKQEIVTASNDLVIVTAEKGQKAESVSVKTDVDKKEYSGCFDQLAGMLGLTLCGEVSVPFSLSGQGAQQSLQKFISHYPLNGATKLKLLLEKNDLRGYHIKGVVRTQPNKNSFELLFEAEGSKNRKTALTGEFVNTDQEKSVALALESPIKNLQGQIALLTKPTEYVCVIKAKMDAEEYFARAGFNVQGNDQHKVFKPTLEYLMPGGGEKKSLKIDGQVIRDVNGPTTKYSLQGIKINLPNSEVVDINGHVGIAGHNVEGDIKAKKGEHNLLVSGSYKDHDVKAEFRNTLNPYLNFKVNGHAENQKGNIRTDIDLHYSGDLKDPQNRVTINQLLKYHKNSPEDFGLITKNKFHIYALPLVAKLDAEADPKKFDLDVEGQYVDKKGEFDLEARRHIKKPGDYSVKVVSSFDKKGFEAFAKRDIVSADKSNLENYLVLKGVGKYELSGVVLHKTKPNDINVGAVGHLKLNGGGKNEDIKFDFGAIENNNLYSSHVKISRSKADLLDFLLKVNRGANPNGQVKLVLKDAVAANGQFKVTDADGKGNGALIVDFKTAQRKIKGDFKFLIKDPVYNAEADLFLNFEKDNADKIRFTTNTKRTEKLFDSKNKLDYAGKKFELNVHKDGVVEVDKDGKLAATVEVVLPTERVLSLKVNRDFVAKANTLNGHAEVVLSDAVKRGGAASTLTYKGKLADSNIEKRHFNYEGVVVIKLKDGKNLENNFFVKNTPQGENKLKYEFKTEVTGSLIPKPAAIAASVDYTDPDVAVLDGQEKYRLKANYGSDFGFESETSEENRILNDKGDKKMQKDNTIQIRLPFEKAHDIKVVTHTFYLLPENKDGFEFSVSHAVQVNADSYKVDASGKYGAKSGHGKIKVVAPHVDPISADGSYTLDVEGAKKTGSVELKSTYGKGKTATIAATATSAGQEYTLNVKGNAPQSEKLKKIEVNIVTKTPSVDSFSNSVIVDADGRVYKSDVALVYSKAHPFIDLKYSSPSSNKPMRLYLKGNALSSNQGKIDVKIENVKDLSLDATSEGTITKDNVVLKLAANSEKLGLKNYKVDISSKDAGSGKRLEFHATNDGKNVFSGSTSYISKQEGPKTIIEGSGSVKVKEDQKSATFKYIRTLLTEGSEQGVETFMNVGIGDRSYVAESRVTNLEYKTSYVYCEEKKQCAHAELNSKVSMPKQGVLEHSVNVGLDLRKLGFSPEFGLQAKGEVSQQRPPRYTVDLHVFKDEKKYHLHAHNTPEHGKLQNGITITLPQRVLAYDMLLTYPTQGTPFPIKADVTLNLDKNKPQLKSAFRMLIDHHGSEKGHNAVAEFGFSHPKLGKEAVIKFNGGVQRPTENEIKIESAASITHPTIGGEKASKFLFEASPVRVKLDASALGHSVVQLEGSQTLKDQEQQAELKVAVLNSKPVLLRAAAKEYKHFEITTSYSEDPQRKLSVVANLDPEKRVEVSADIILAAEKKNIIHGALFLQDNLVKSDYGLSKDNFNYFVNALKNDVETLKTRVEGLGEQTSQEFKKTMSKVEPSIKQLEESYVEEIKKLTTELSDDKVLKEISVVLHDIVQFVATTVKEIIDVTKPIVDKIQQTISEACKKITELYEKQLQGQLKQFYTNVAAVVKEAVEGVIDLVAHFAAVVQDFFDKHKPELQELTNTIAEIFKDLTKLIVAQLKEVRSSTAQFLGDLYQQIKEMPILGMIQEKIKELAVPEQFLAILGEAHQAIRVVLPTEEAKVLSDTIAAYVQKKLRQEKVDDAVELRKIYEKFAVALTSVIQFVKAQLNQVGVPNLVNFNVLPLVSGPGQSLPAYGRVPGFSVVNHLIHGDLPNPLAYLRAYRPRSINPLDEIPNKLRAVVVNGQHIFTFDGRHLTFPGTCRYVLAHDHVDRNFTAVIQLQAGAPKAVLLEDKSGTTVELRENGQVAVNGAAHGYPVIEKDIFAFRTPAGLLGIGTTYGFMAFCTSKLTVCYFEASGFYLGKLRGLLGDGNNEPFDDFRLPNGKIVSSEAEFGNAYKLSGSCAAVKTPEHAHAHGALPPACEKVFGSTSPLRPLALLLDVAPFKQACVHAVASNAANAQQEACDLAKGYTALAVTGLLPAVLPSVCVQCTDADKPREIGESYKFTLPAKQADVVVAVDTTKANEKNYKELVVPLVSQLVDTLKSKKIDDIKVYLIGRTSKMPYPIVYDADNKLKGAKIVFDDESRYRDIPTINTDCEKLNSAQKTLAAIANELRIRLGLTNIDASTNSPLDFPLRPGAVKHFIFAFGEPCKRHLFVTEFLRGLTANFISKQNAISATVITATPDIKIGGGKNAAEIIGFDSESVLLIGDKKRSKDATLRSSLELSREDACIETALAMDDGLVLSASNYLALPAPQQKQFLHAAATAAADAMLRESLVQDCTCSYVNPFVARSVCVNEERKEAARRRK